VGLGQREQLAKHVLVVLSVPDPAHFARRIF